MSEESSVYEKRADNSRYLNFNRTTNAPTMRFTITHFHESLEMAAVTKGRLTVRIEGEEKTLAPGEIAFVPSFSTHCYRAEEENTEYIVLVMSSKFFSGVRELEGRTFAHFPEKTDETAMLFDTLEALLQSYSHRSAETLRRGIAEVALGIMLSIYPTHPIQNNPGAQVIREVLRYINANLSGELSLEFLSDHFGYTKNHFSFIFNKFAGMSLREYINRRRLDRVLALREENKTAPLYHLVFEAGFDSQNTFYRAAKKYGVEIS